MPKNNEIKTRNKSRKKHNSEASFPWVKVIGIVCLTPVIIGALIIGILYASTYDIKYQPKTFASYFQDIKGIGVESFIVEGNQISLDIPLEVLGTEIWVRLKDLKGSSHFKVKQIGFNKNLDKILVNASYYGVNVPFSLKFSPEVVNNTITLSFDQLTFGDGGLTFKNKMGLIILKKFLGEDPTIIINAKEIIGNELLTVQSLTVFEQKGRLKLAVDMDRIKADLNKLKTSGNEEIINWTREGVDETAQAALEILMGADTLTTEQVEVLIQDCLTNQEMITNILLFSDLISYQEILEQYNQYLSQISSEAVLAKQIAILKQPLNELYTSLTNGMNQNQEFQERTTINQRKLYNLALKEYIPFKEIAAMSTASISQSLQDKLDFCYDSSRDLLLLNYQLDDQQKLLVDSENIWKIDQSEFDVNFGVQSFGEPELVTDAKRYQEIEDLLAGFFKTEKAFIRYLKADEKYAYAIASSPESYQNYVVFVLIYQDEKWSILQTELNTLADFNQQDPDFNMELVLFEEDVVLYDVDKEMQDTIYADLKDRKIIKSTDITIDYISYGNGYIALMLSNGEKYIYRLNKLFLETVYDQDQALKVWDSIPELITLQSIEE